MQFAFVIPSVNKHINSPLNAFETCAAVMALSILANGKHFEKNYFNVVYAIIYVYAQVSGIWLMFVWFETQQMIIIKRSSVKIYCFRISKCIHQISVFNERKKEKTLQHKLYMCINVVHKDSFNLFLSSFNASLRRSSLFEAPFCAQ